MITSVSVVHPESPPEVRRKHEQVQENRQKVSKVQSVNPSPHFAKQEYELYGIDSKRRRAGSSIESPSSSSSSTTTGSKFMATEPTFSLYVYDEGGELKREPLSLHDIQQILLVQSQVRVGSKVMKTLLKLFCFPGRNSASPSCAGSLPLMATTTTTTMKISRTTL